jgi:hypothetical protein
MHQLYEVKCYLRQGREKKQEFHAKIATREPPEIHYLKLAGIFCSWGVRIKDGLLTSNSKTFFLKEGGFWSFSKGHSRFSHPLILGLRGLYSIEIIFSELSAQPG